MFVFNVSGVFVSEVEDTSVTFVKKDHNKKAELLPFGSLSSAKVRSSH